MITEKKKESVVGLKFAKKNSEDFDFKSRWFESRPKEIREVMKKRTGEAKKMSCHGGCVRYIMLFENIFLCFLFACHCERVHTHIRTSAFKV